MGRVEAFGARKRQRKAGFAPSLRVIYSFSVPSNRSVAMSGPPG